MRVLERDDDAVIEVTAGGARTTLPVRDGESDDALAARIRDAARELRWSRDAASSTRLERGATTTGFTDGHGATAVAVDPAVTRSEGGLAANTPAYPARIVNHGADVTVAGATNEFTMEIDYGAASVSMQDEVFNRMQPIAYKWELLDVTNVQPNAEIPREEAGSGIARNIGREWENVVEDTRADLRDAFSPSLTPWEARATWLAVVGISDVIRMGGSLISSYFALVTQPLNERSIGLAREGDFLVRCIAQPILTDYAREHIEHPIVGAPSVAAVPIRVMSINRRAVEANDAELERIRQLERMLENPPPGMTRADVQRALDEARTAARDHGRASALGRGSQPRDARRPDTARSLHSGRRAVGGRAVDPAAPPGGPRGGARLAARRDRRAAFCSTTTGGRRGRAARARRGAGRPPRAHSVKLREFVAELRRNAAADNTNAEILHHLPAVMDGLTNPRYMAEVMADLWHEMQASGVSLTEAAIRLSEASSGRRPAVIPEDYGRGPGAHPDFFRDWASRGESFVDRNIDTEEHGQLAHLLQDLPVDRALAARVGEPTFRSAQFRELLARAAGDPTRPGRLRITVGDEIWRITYDEEVPGLINFPEVITERLRRVFPDLEQGRVPVH